MILFDIDLSALAHAWLAAMLRASWQGAVVIALVWCLCRCLPAMSARMRCWLWRLALLKVLLIAAWPSAIELPWLPSALTEESSGSLITTAIPVSSNTAQPAIPSNATAGPAAPRDSISLGTVLALILAAIWAAGLVLIGAVLITRIRAARRWRSRCTLVKDAQVLTLCERLCADLGVSQPPLLLAGEACANPVVFGALRTCVVLPASLVHEVDTRRLGLVLRHELAHIRRGDLLWNWAATAIWAVFFFHPLVWIALRELRLNQELACDACAVAARETSVADYGSLLVELAGRNRVPANMLVTVGVVESFDSLKRRLGAMKDLHAYSRWVRSLSAALLAAGVVGLLPWRLVAQSPRTAAPPAAKGTDAKAPAEDEEVAQPPVATTTAGKYKIVVDKLRWAGGHGLVMTDTGFPFDGKMETREERHDGPGGGTRTMTATGGGGFGGSFIRPNLILDLRVEEGKADRGQLLCTVVGKPKATDESGNQLEAPDSAAWIRTDLGGVPYPQGPARTPLHLYVGDKDARTIKSLSGEMLVAEAKIQTASFQGGDLNKVTTRRLKDTVIRLDKVETTEDGITVTVSVSAPGDDDAADPRAMMRSMGDMGRIRVALEDTDGMIHYSHGGGSTASSSSSLNNGRRTSGAKKPMTTKTATFEPLMEEVKIKKITCTVTDLLGKPQRVAFQFHDLPLP